MDQEKQHDIALMRYSVISPVISGLPETYSCLLYTSFLRPCYAIGVFFGCFSWLLTWGK